MVKKDEVSASDAKNIFLFGLFQWRAFPFLLTIMVCSHSCIDVGYSKSPCEITYFHDDNKQNDTSKVIFDGRAVFDTTANMLYGVIVDSLTSKPIVGAKVYINNGSTRYSDSSDLDGRFSFFKDGFSGQWQMIIDDKTHRCLVIDNINVSGRLGIRIKLHGWLTNNPNQKQKTGA